MNQALSAEEVKLLHNIFSHVAPYTYDEVILTKQRSEWWDDDDDEPNPTYYDVLCTPDGMKVEQFNGCLVYTHIIITQEDRAAIVAQIELLKHPKSAAKLAVDKSVAKPATEKPAPVPKQFLKSAFHVQLYDLLAKNNQRIMSAKMRFEICSTDATHFNVHDDTLYVETLNQSLGVLLQQAYWYYSPKAEKENILSIGELKTRLEEARMALRRIPCELVIAKQKVNSLQAKLDASTTDDQRARYINKISEAQIVICQLEAEERQQTLDIAEYERQRALRSSASARPKPVVESPEFALIMRAIKSLNTRNKKSEIFLADFMEYAATFHKQTAEEKFNEDVTASGVSLNFRPMPAKRVFAPIAAEPAAALLNVVLPAATERALQVDVEPVAVAAVAAVAEP